MWCNKMKLLRFIIFPLLFLFAACTSIKQPESVFQPLDYNDQDVVENEIQVIRSLQEKESSRALFRACLLRQKGLDNGIVEECALLVQKEAEEAEGSKDYVNAMRLYKSLASVDYEKEKNDEAYKRCASALYKEVPGFSSDEEKLPKTIQDCINATVTVWVDQGYKVDHGAGYLDVVIGSGFFIDRRGYIITNHHVIAEMVNPKRKTSCKLYIKLPSDMEKKLPAKVVGYDPVMDLALLKVDMVEEPDFVFELGSSYDLEVGDSISVIGTPLGLEGTLTSGIISSSSRQLLTMGSVFQIDAAVNSGNSGGPLIDSNHKVQAVVFAGMLQYQGLNFAIPVEYLKQELPLLYNGGEVKHCWTAAYGHDKKIRNEKLGLEIQYVMPGGSANLSGLQLEDVIVSADGQKITCLEELQFLFMKYEPSTILKCSFDHYGVEKECILFLEEREEEPLKMIFASDFVEDAFIPIFGIKMVRSSTTNKKLYRIDYVLEGSTADLNGFSENDNLELRDIYFDDENKIFMALVVVQRKKKGFLDIQMQLASSYDSPNYF